MDTWEIILLENFTVKEINYYMDEKDKIIETPQFIRTLIATNGQGPGGMNFKYTFKQDITETAEFSETTGYSVNYSTTSTEKFGSPSINYDLTLTNQMAMGNSWSYTTKKTQTQKTEETLEVNYAVPPYTNLAFDFYKSNYQANITYVATFVGNTTGKIIKLRGKYKGDHFARLSYTVRDIKTNRIVAYSE